MYINLHKLKNTIEVIVAVPQPIKPNCGISI